MDEKQTSQPGNVYTILQKHGDLNNILLLPCILTGIGAIPLVAAIPFLLFPDLQSSNNIVLAIFILIISLVPGTLLAFLPFLIFYRCTEKRLKAPIQNITSVPSLRKVVHASLTLISISGLLKKHGDLLQFKGSTFLLSTLQPGSKPSIPHINPIPIPFEPVRLTNSLPDSRLAGILGQSSLTKNKKGKKIANSIDPLETKTFLDRPRLLVAGVCVVPFILKHFFPQIIFGPLLYLIPVSLGYFAYHRLFQTQHSNYLIPGGALFRKAKYLQKRWTLRHFDRRDCVTFIKLPVGYVSNATIHIINTQTHEQVKFSLSSDAFAIFLSAWLSPLQTPTLEEMSDFT